MAVDPSWDARKHLLTQTTPSLLSSVMPMHKHNSAIRSLITKRRNTEAFALYESLLHDYEKSSATTSSTSSSNVFRPDHSTFALAVTILRRMNRIDRLPSVFEAMKRLGVVPNKLVFDQLVDPFGAYLSKL